MACVCTPALPVSDASGVDWSLLSLFQVLCTVDLKQSLSFTLTPCPFRAPCLRSSGMVHPVPWSVPIPWSIPWPIPWSIPSHGPPRRPPSRYRPRPRAGIFTSLPPVLWASLTPAEPHSLLRQRQRHSFPFLSASLRLQQTDARHPASSCSVLFPNIQTQPVPATDYGNALLLTNASPSVLMTAGTTSPGAILV